MGNNDMMPCVTKIIISLFAWKLKASKRWEKIKCFAEQDKIPSVIKIRDINSCQY